MNDQHFASIYDKLMEDVPYDQWLKFTMDKVAKGSKIVDLACGTGTLAIKFHEAGYRVSAVDLSQDMLTVAENKLRERQLSIPLYRQDMKEFTGFSNLDAVTLFCDGLNYLQKEEDVQRTFVQVAEALRTDGIFLFDVHSPYKMEHIFNDELYGENGEDVSYLWFCTPGECPYSVDHTLSFFIKLEDGLYERIDEEHSQRTFSAETYVRWLEAAGFKDIKVTSDFGSKHLEEADERIFFQAIKK